MTTNPREKTQTVKQAETKTILISVKAIQYNHC
jgi:hypothetical protein